ncbi:hypothetical protein KFK09_011807 [Dendrobium nobile]|uniref:U1-type domain-containing protein n=1 Tax=Dendrobium nobile TaxID=94219 RepID=A0A8T3BDP2_DENNO|nr:hypothetical protein KFK09_011807 [Dendrobium nobile]
MNKLPLSNPSRMAIEREIMKERIREEILAREMVERRILEEEVRREIAMERIIELRRLQMERWPGLAGTSGMVMHGDRQTQTLKPSSLEAVVAASPGRGIAQDAAEFAFRDRSSSRLLPKITTAVMAQSAVRHESEKRSPSNETTTSNCKLSGAKKMIQAKKQWGCALCKVSSSSEEALKDHLRGRKHKAKEALLLSNKKTGLLQSKQNLSPPLDGGPLKNKLSEGKKQQQKLWCSLCKVKCNSSIMLENHKAGRQHRNLMESKKANCSSKTEAVKTSK